jgi:phosphatidylglycerophosphate synthase
LSVFIPAAIVLAPFSSGLALLIGRDLRAAMVALAVFVVIALIAGRGLAAHYPHDRLGSCNLVTLFRGALVGAIAGLLVAPMPGTLTEAAAWGVVGVAAVSLALDGVDGRLARSSGLVSDFGARFDMEVDSVFALVLALMVWLSGTVGAWVLVLGVMRYLYVVAGWVLPWLNGPLPEQVMRRKTVCVIQIGALIVLNAPIVTGLTAVVLAAVASALLVWSFAVDVVWLWKRRAG